LGIGGCTSSSQARVRETRDAELERRIEQEFFARAKGFHAAFLGAQIVQVSDTETVSLSCFPLVQHGRARRDVTMKRNRRRTMLRAERL
jgi:hypothetical protein